MSTAPASSAPVNPAHIAQGAQAMYQRPVEALPEGGFRISVDVKTPDDLAEVLRMLRGI